MQQLVQCSDFEVFCLVEFYYEQVSFQDLFNGRERGVSKAPHVALTSLWCEDHYGVADSRYEVEESKHSSCTERYWRQFSAVPRNMEGFWFGPNRTHWNTEAITKTFNCVHKILFRLRFWEQSYLLVSNLIVLTLSPQGRFKVRTEVNFLCYESCATHRKYTRHCRLNNPMHCFRGSAQQTISDGIRLHKNDAPFVLCSSRKKSGWDRECQQYFCYYCEIMPALNKIYLF